MTATITLRLEDDVKQELDKLVEELGMTTSAFFTVYAKQAIREQRIPFILSAAAHSGGAPSHLSVTSLADARAIELLEKGIAEADAGKLAMQQAQEALAGAADEAGIANEEDVQRLIDEIRYGAR